MKRMMFLLLVFGLTMVWAQMVSAQITYTLINPFSAPLSATGTITTDGKMGTLGASDILSWDITVADGIHTTEVLTPSNPGASVTVDGADLTATPTALIFNFGDNAANGDLWINWPSTAALHFRDIYEHFGYACSGNACEDFALNSGFSNYATNHTMAATIATAPGPTLQTISHIADGGGWRSTIILVNTGTVAALYTVSFWDDPGSPYVPPLASGSATGTIPVGGSTIIETADTALTLSEGWAQVTSSQSIGGTAIFRYDPWGQEAAVPLLTTGGTELEIPYQVGNGLSLGVALANPSTTETANITQVIRDENGNQLSSQTLTLAPLNHTAFNPTFPANTTGGGVVEYDSNTSIYAIGIRAAPEANGLAFTSVPAVYK